MKSATLPTSVKSMLAMADAQKEALVGEGMSPTLLEQLGKMLAEFEAASESARASMLDHIGARADLEEVTVELTEMVKALDGINRWRFGSTPELLVEWNAAKHVRASGASPRGPAGPVAGGTEVPGGIAPPREGRWAGISETRGGRRGGRRPGVSESEPPVGSLLRRETEATVFVELDCEGMQG